MTATVIGKPGDKPEGSAVRSELRARGQSHQVLRRFLTHRLAVASFIIFLIMIASAFVVPLFWKWDYLSSDGNALSQPPSIAHPFGTDAQGYDLFGQILRGIQVSLEVSFIAVLIDSVIGIIVGALAGYYRGVTDSVLMRLADLVLTIPSIALLAVLARNTAGNAVWIGVVIGLLSWAVTSRLVRAEFLSLRERDFIEAARAIGASDRRIMMRHIAPNALGTIIVNATLTIAVAIILEAALSFIGFGVQRPDVSLGQLISTGVNASQTRPWLFYFPGLIIIALVLSINAVGDAVRDAFDPTSTRAKK